MSTSKNGFYVRCFGIFFLALFPLFTIGQDTDSGSSSTGYEPFGAYSDSEPDATAPPDSSIVEARNFDAATLHQLKSDRDLQYKEPPTVAESLWERILTLIGEFLDSLFENAVGTDWGRVFMYVVGIVLIVMLVMMILKVDAFKIFYSGQGASGMPHHILDENIHEMDFDALIKDAIAERDYRKAIRLLFLSSLKALADKNLIHWEQGKTNHDYLQELSSDELRPGFHELNYYFEYAWYGNFSISGETFLQVQQVFSAWRSKVR